MAEQKWYSSKGEPKDGSVTTVDDVVFFCQGMYDYVNRLKRDSSDDNNEVDEAERDVSANTKSVASLKNDTDADNSDSSDVSDVVVPDDYIFPGYMRLLH